jgi:TonB dependent receptor/Carboxypeptidase regulatory-like domain
MTFRGLIMQQSRLSFRVISLLIAAALICSQAAAQVKPASEASLRVTVLDPSGARVIAAQVKLKGADKARALDTNEQGQSFFTNLAPGRYEIQVVAEGFEPQVINDFSIKAGPNTVEARLEVAGVKEEVTVKQDERERATDPRGNSFTNVLTQDQIAALPDDPDEFEAAVRSMAGPGAPIRVNGFRGGKLPPKSQIRQIRFRMNPYAAENHESNFMSIDVLTKPGVNRWHGSFSFGFRDESLNARNSFAPARGPEQHRRAGFSVDGPLWPGHTSLFLSADVLSAYDSKTIVAALPEENFAGLVRRPTRVLNLSAKVEHALTKSHTLYGEYQRNANLQHNLGVGDFDLVERAYSSDQAEHILRFSDTGLLTKRFVNELRFQARWNSIGFNPSSDAPATIVLNAFNAGGAQMAGARRASEFELSDNIDFAYGKHAMRAGILIERASYTSDETRNYNGTFTFASLEDFRARRPTTFTRRLGDPRVSFDQYQLGLYWQDDFRLSKALSLSLGLRHEVQSNLGDDSNFAPRFGLAWSPFKDGKTTIRAGAGVFYDWLAAEVYEQTLRVDGERQREMVVQSPGFPDPADGSAPVLLPPSRIQLAPSLRMPQVVQGSAGIERQMGKYSRLIVNYMHQRGSDLFRGHNINAPARGAGRPDTAAGNINQIESTASSTMNGLSVNLNLTNPLKHFFMGVSYFLSKTVDESDGPLSLPADNLNLGAERGPAAGDVRHRLFAMVNTPLAFGLRLGAVFTASSAPPYNITTGFDDNGDSVSNDRPEGLGRNSARGAGRWDVGVRLGRTVGFGRAPEQQAGHGTPRLVRINGDRDPLGAMPSLGGMNNRYRLEFYAQAYNIFNRTNRVNFSGVETSPFFGAATAALPGRRIETGVRLSF